MLTRALTTLILGGLLGVAGCGPSKKEKAAAEAKQAEEVEIDKRAQAIAGKMVQKSEQDADQRQKLAAQQAATEKKQQWQRVVDHPEQFLEPDNLQTVDKGPRRLTSLSVTNKSKFAVSDVRGTLDFHGVADGENGEGDILAKVPIQLTGSIAAGASMVFSEQQKTLSGAAIKLDKAPARVSFSVTGVRLVDPGDTAGVQNAPVSDGGMNPARL